MKLQDFLDAQNIQMRVIYYPNQSGRWSAMFDYCDLAENGLLRGVHGNGKTPAEAIRVYLREVRGKRMKFEQRYFVVPDHVEYTYP